MTPSQFLKGFFAVLYCGMVTYICYFQQDRETHPEEGYQDNDVTPRYRNVFPTYMLPAMLIIFVLFCIEKGDWLHVTRQVLGWAFGIFIHGSVFFVGLLVVIPGLRRFISARSCAQLWLLPCMSYILAYELMGAERPLWVIKLPAETLDLFAMIWLTGAAGVFLYHVLSHLVFRFQILRRAIPVKDPEILALWEEEKEDNNIKAKLRLVISEQVKTPLSIGLFSGTIRVVLPKRQYTPEDLRLIFRHELVHISRDDSGNKLFMVIYTSFCWFNPLMWVAMKRSAEDLELSCDETVLIGADEETRQRYAALILNTSGDQRGFTTCLSATAKTMRYRLKNIVKARKVYNGALVVGLFLFVFIMTCGYVCLGYDRGSSGQLIFGDTLTDYSLLAARYYEEATGSDHYTCVDEVALKEYLSGFQLTTLTGNYEQEDDPELILTFSGSKGVFGLILNDETMALTPLYGDRRGSDQYLLDQKVDWEYLMSLFERSINYYDETMPDQPEMTMTLYEAGENGVEWEGPLLCPGVVVTRTENGKVTESLDPADIPAVAWFTDVNGKAEAEVSFSHIPYGSIVVELENWDRTEQSSIAFEDFITADRFPLADYDAHYTVGVTFQMEDSVTVNMVYKFDVQYEE